MLGISHPVRITRERGHYAVFGSEDGSPIGEAETVEEALSLIE